MNGSSTVYRGYTQKELDAQYDQRTLVPDLTPYRNYWEEAGAAARRGLECRVDVAYGASAWEKLDLFPAPAGGGAPVIVNFHGGAWVRLTKVHAAFPAPGFVAAGAAFVCPDFAPATEVSLDEMVRQARAAVAWVHENAGGFGGDPDRVFISGHSSGAHLAAMVLAGGWLAGLGLPEDLVKGAVVASGSYDLAPVRLSARNGYLHLDDTAARRLSPIHHLPETGLPLCIAWGDGDLDEFRRQGAAFVAAWRAAGNRCAVLERPGHNHFDIASGFGDPGSPMVQAALRMMGLAAG